jgi:NAD+ synthase (glutamine-hydrolysing)
MNDGFVRVAVATPAVKVADCQFNADRTVELMVQADQQSVSLVVFPEMGLTAYTCADLFLQPTLLNGATSSLIQIVEASAVLDVVTVVGLPLIWQGKLYNCAAVVHKGAVLAVVPKTFVPSYGEFYELRWFTAAPEYIGEITIGNWTVPFGTDLLFQSAADINFSFAVEICEDLWVPGSPSVRHAQAGATILTNLSASDEIVGKADYKRQMIAHQSGRLLSAYLYANAGTGESTTDLVFAGHDLIAENGIIIAESQTPFEGLLIGEVDVARLAAERMRNNTFMVRGAEHYRTITFSQRTRSFVLTRTFSRYPFVPPEGPDRTKRCETIRMIQAVGLMKRLQHTQVTHVVVGLSGGLDSTLALLVAVDAFDRLSLPREGIIAITMPCFGTTDRTRGNARTLATAVGVTLREIDITASVLQHFADIGHDKNVHDVTFENAQARERTQVLMDIANTEQALVIGTGDLSELALGWATYNGDHMSMYSVNASVPKTLIRHLVALHADESDAPELAQVLRDVLATPVSPELLPATEGNISQVTEDIVGPYELHDFFLYYMLRWSYPPQKVFRLACHVFNGVYETSVILRWLQVFYRRFFSQQFKRSALPDGPKVGSVAVSPRGDLRMPSDACVSLWQQELEKLKSDVTT